MEDQNPVLQNYNRFPKWLTTVTPLSKALAMILFILFPFIGFYMGMQYQQKVTVSTPVVSKIKKTSQPTLTSKPTAAPSLIPAANPDEIALWKTHSNNKYKFELRYPNDWGRLICQGSPFGGDEGAQLGPEFFANPSKHCQTDLVPTFGLSIVDKITDKKKLEDVGFKELNRKSITVGNVSAEMIDIETINAPFPDNFTEVFVPLNNKYLNIALYDIKYKNLFEQILQTFRFSD